MLVITVNLTAFAVVREREIGTLEQVMVSPIRPMEFILGKTLPSFLIGIVEATMITLVGTLWFQVPFRGNPLVLLLGVSLFLTCTLGMGLLISTVCKTQQQAFASSFFIVTPGFTLSGFSFPIASMPQVHAVAHLPEPAPLPPGRPPRDVPEGRRALRALAADAGDGTDRGDGAERERVPLPQVARLTA